MSTMQFIVIYDTTGRIISQYASTNMEPPVGVPYLILNDYDMTEGDDYRRIEKVDVSVEPNVPIFSLTAREQEIANMSIDEYRELRQNENKLALAEFLKNNPITWIDGLQYGVTQEDQSEMIADKTAYEFKKQLGDTSWTLQWHSIKADCREFTENEFAGLFNAIINFVYPYRQLEMQYKDEIYSAKTKEEISSVEIKYEI